MTTPVNLKDERTKRAIKQELKKYLSTALQKEQILLAGMAAHFCATHQLQPEQIELIKTLHGTETRFHFRRREGALFLPGNR